MPETTVKIKKLHPEAKIPIHVTKQAAGCDIYAVESLIIEPGETKKVPTGIALEIPEGFYLRVEDRSGLALKGVHRVGGIVDSDYRGELFVMLHNSGTLPYKIEKHDRIAQGIITPFSQADFEEVFELSQSERGDKGFHSTGK